MIHGRQSSASKLITSLALSMILSTQTSHAEQLFGQDVRVKTGDGPTVLLEQDTTASLPAQVWSVRGDEVGWSVNDETSQQIPLIVFKGAPSNSLAISTVGQIGIGTTAPQGNLHVYGLADADVFTGIGPDLTGTGTALNIGYAAATFGRGSGFFNVRPAPGALGPNPSLRFATANVQRVIIDKVGNVGIGDFGTGLGQSPQSRLHVRGDIRVEGGNFIANGSTLNVPDYVFEDDYKLLPLKQLAKFIEQEKHLPEIPSAKEIQTEGVNITDLQMRLLKKIEELTLYTLQQEEMIAQLRERLTKVEQLQRQTATPRR